MGEFSKKNYIEYSKTENKLNEQNIKSWRNSVKI